MSELSVLSTEGLHAPRQRIEFWNSCAADTLRVPICIDAANLGRFWGRLAHIGLRSLHIAEFSSDAAVVRHARKHTAAYNTDAFLIVLQMSGSTCFSQAGKEIRLSPGDFTLVNCGRPYELSFKESVANLVLTIGRDQLRHYIACPESMAAVRLSGTTGASALASRFLRELWRRPEELLASSGSPFLDRAIFDMIATAYGANCQSDSGSTEQAAIRRIAIVQHIEDRLSDPDLGPESIARAFKVTSRCVHRLFDGQGETLGSYIRRRRLEECARALRSPLLRGRSISSIAFDYGFSSIAHFSKVFRDHYDGSPSGYRKQNLSQCPEFSVRSDGIGSFKTSPR